METAAEIVWNLTQRLANFLDRMEGISGDETPRLRSASVSDRDIEQVVTLDTSDEAHRGATADTNNIFDHFYTGEHHHDSSLNMPGSLGFELPSPPENFLNGAVPAPLIQAGVDFLDQLPDISLDDIPNVSGCNICMDPFGSTEDPESPVQLPCGHVMGRKCISRWLETSNSCPLCRRVLFEQEGSFLFEQEGSSLFGQEAFNRSWDNLEPRLQELVRSLTAQQQQYLLQVLQELTPPRTEAGQGEQLEIPRASPEEVEAYRAEYHEITLQRDAIDTRLAEIETENTPLTSERATELRELEEDNEMLRARLDNFHVRYRDLINFTLFN